MRTISLSLINVVLILLTVALHKVIYRLLLWSYDSLIMYWGLFVGIFFVMNLIVNYVFLRKK
ncbi:bacteriocin-like WGxF protein [Sinobaca sp. H24]|uniref:bacteriocin-like WGxF protein n=1 Tax=Sinobaca sp. H24 TaxID=2923376 RepID=UPI0020796C18|nr:bacteriocin-like WGxF protein [Sinobaca sp. H24]